MSDKNITELEWKKFSKGKGFKDTAFVKALAALELGKTPEAKLAALDAIEKEGDALRKANKADKLLGSYLDDAAKAAAKERKLQEAEKAAASSEDDEDSPAALTVKMIPLLRAVRKGEVMHTMVAITGKEVAVMVSKRPIAPPRRKLLTDYLGVTGGVKFAGGECIWEESAHTFVLSTQAGGLAKKIKAALLKQVEQRFKVRVRGEDPADIDDDGEPVEQEAGESQGSEGVATTNSQQQQPTTSTIPEAPPMPKQGGEQQVRGKTEGDGSGTVDEGAAFNARLAALMPKVKETITAAGPNAADVKLKVSEAGVFARKKAFEQAHALLDEAEQLMEGGSSLPSEAAQYEARRAQLEPQVLAALKLNPAEATRLRAVFNYAGEQAEANQWAKALNALSQVEKLLGGGEGMKAASDAGYKGIVAYRKTLLDLRAAVARVEGQISALVQAIPSQLPDEADLAEELAENLREANDELLDLVDDAMGAAENEEAPITQALTARLDALIGEVAGNEVIKHVDKNPFGVPMSVEATLSAALKAVRVALPVPA